MIITIICKQCQADYTYDKVKRNKLQYCPDCSSKRKRAAVDRVRVRNGVKVGVGSGNNQPSGKASPYYKNGISQFIKTRNMIKGTIQYCEKCEKDLKESSHYNWCVHHKDGDRTNNERNNLQLLCKKCHQNTHHCGNNWSKNRTKEERSKLSKKIAKERKRNSDGQFL